MALFDWAFFVISKLLAIQVTVKEGVLEGNLVASRYGSPYFSFKGIPYAEPPLGDLRFKAPVPKSPWQGVREAKQHGPICYQYDVRASGSEDCLYLNVYTPNIAPVKSLPVMVWIHGGGFTRGSADEHSPEFFMRKEVILVTLNYRLEVLGFLSLDNEYVPGNAGIKDQVAALRWVKENIQRFGGDPNNITIFGASAGGMSVSFHLVSPMTRGLFNRAIVQSGALTNLAWVNTFRARDRGLALARELGCSSKDDKDIYECLKAQPVENLVNKPITVTYVQTIKEAPAVHFGIVSERQFDDNEVFFAGHPYEILRKGIHEGVQIMNGYAEDEGVLYFILGTDADKVLEQANKFKEFFVPEPHTINTTLATQMEIGEIFKEYYMGDKDVSLKTLDNLLRYFNMDLFVYGVIALQKIVTKTSVTKNYLYKFTCKSELNVMTRLTGVDWMFEHREVTAHGDDFYYIFPFPPGWGPQMDMNSKEFKLIDQVTTLWTNFAKYGDPTPDDSLGAKWLPYTIEGQEYLDIGEDLVPGTFPEKEDLQFWENNFKEFLPKLVP